MTYKEPLIDVAERQVLGLSTLLQLGQEARSAKDIQSLAFLVVNESQRLVAYDQAILVMDRKVLAVSGLAQPDRHSDLFRGFAAAVKTLVAQDTADVQVVEDLGATKLKDIGRCMSALKERYPGKIESGPAGKVMRKALTANKEAAK